MGKPPAAALIRGLRADTQTRVYFVPDVPPDNQPAAAEPRKGLTKKELAADHPTWCPGCGDFSVLALYFKLIERTKLWHEKFVSVSGIGCSSRFPYFVQAHGIHFIHGRALPFAVPLVHQHGELELPAVFPDPFTPRKGLPAGLRQ